MAYLYKVPLRGMAAKRPVPVKEPEHEYVKE